MVKKYLLNFWRSFSLAAVFLLILLIVISGWIWRQLEPRVLLSNYIFTSQTQRSLVSLMAEGLTGLKIAKSLEYPQRRWLILGTDEVPGSNRTDILTDTMILVSLNPATQQLKLLSLPRDIYLPQLRLKINALYNLGVKNQPLFSTIQVQQVVSEMIGQPVDGVLVFSLSDIENLIDRLGGIWIDVPNSFTDNNFPRSGVDVTQETDPTILYETVSFNSGEQWMDGASALKYMRSRKATEVVEQGDQARQRRQQLVMQATLQRLQQLEVIGQPQVLGSLYDWYSLHVMPIVPLAELGWLVASWPNQNVPSLETIAVPVTDYPYATDSATLFIHPAESKYGQWAYEPVDPTWQQLQQYLQAQNF